MSDPRLDWVREKVTRGLGVETSLFDQHLASESAVTTITKFLDGGENDGQDRVLRWKLVINSFFAGNSALLVTLEQLTIQVEEIREAPQ